MSAWIVSKKHIDYLVTAGIAAELIRPSKATETGRMLWAECLRSVAYRYPNDDDGDRPGPTGFRDGQVDRYEWRETPVLTGGMLAKTLGCYDYQSCEHPGYGTSEAFVLVRQMLETTGGVEYDEQAPWGWDDWDERGHHAPDIAQNQDGARLVRCVCGWMGGWSRDEAEFVAAGVTKLRQHLEHFGVAVEV